MCACLEDGRFENVKTLVLHGAEIHRVDKDGKSALHFAATFLSPKVVMYLLSVGMSVNMTDNSDQTPLMCACLEGGRFENVKTLVIHDAEIHSVEKDGKSALHFTATFSSSKVVMYLLSLGMSVNMTHKSGLTPMMCTCLEGGRFGNVKTLILQCAESHKVDKDGKSALHFAATFSSPEVVMYLLSVGMSVNMTDKSGLTPLMCACLEGGRIENIKALVIHDAKIHRVDKDGKSALHFAAKFSSSEVVMYLLSLGMSVNMTDNSSRSPLMCACLEGGRFENVKTLIEYGADITRSDTDGKSALHFAASYLSSEAIEYLLSLGMTVNTIDKSDRTQLLFACLRGGHLDNLRMLCGHSIDIKQQKCNVGWSALHFAAKYSSPDVLKYLLSLGSPVNLTTERGQTPLMFVCLEGGRSDNIKTLIEYGGTNIHQLYNNGESALHVATTDSNPKIIDYLLSLGMIINMTTKHGRTPLMCACLKGCRLDNIKCSLNTAQILL